MHPTFNPNGIRTHDLQIMTVHFMSLRRLLTVMKDNIHSPNNMQITTLQTALLKMNTLSRNQKCPLYSSYMRVYISTYE